MRREPVYSRTAEDLERLVISSRRPDDTSTTGLVASSSTDLMSGTMVE